MQARRDDAAMTARSQPADGAPRAVRAARHRALVKQWSNRALVKQWPNRALVKQWSNRDGAAGCMAITSTIAAKVYDVPLVLSYHTHLPVYAERSSPTPPLPPSPPPSLPPSLPLPLPPSLTP